MEVGKLYGLETNRVDKQGVTKKEETERKGSAS
jgi:hypothetical protein